MAYTISLDLLINGYAVKSSTKQGNGMTAKLDDLSLKLNRGNMNNTDRGSLQDARRGRMRTNLPARRIPRNTQLHDPVPA